MMNENIKFNNWFNSKIGFHKPLKKPVANISSQRIKLSLYFPLHFENLFKILHIEVRDNRSKRPRRSKRRPTNPYDKFHRDVMEIGGHKCIKCGATQNETRLTVHHLKSFAKEPDWGFDPDAAAILCLDCHCLFHYRYTFYDFTSENFFEFLNTDEEQFKHNITPKLPWWWETNMSFEGDEIGN